MNEPKPTEEEMWAGQSGQRWLANATHLEKSLQPFGEELITRAGISPGEHVVDVGCGAGAMTLSIAERVAPHGSVTGLDISPDLVAEGTRRAREGLPGAPVTFINGDAARMTFPVRPDCVISRFGVMFFTNPYEAFTHIRRQIRPGGRLAMACWAPLADNPWMQAVRSVMAAHFDIPVPAPRTPGPMAFDQPDYLRDILATGGFSGIAIERWETRMHVGGPGSDPDSGAGFLLQSMGAAKHAAHAPEALKAQLHAELRDKLAPHMTGNGVAMPAAVWFATGRA